jgi:hypothetical protein
MKERNSGFRNESSNTKRTGLFQRITAAFSLPFIFNYPIPCLVLASVLTLLVIFNSVMNQVHLYHMLINLVEKDKNFEWISNWMFSRIKVKPREYISGKDHVPGSANK